MQNLGQMLADLPTACDVGCKKNSKGYKETWTGYKLHIDVACGQIPVSCVLTSASVHDSQVAIPLMTMTSARVSYLSRSSRTPPTTPPRSTPRAGARPRPHRRPQLSRRPRRRGRMGPRSRAPEAHPHARLRRPDLRFPHHGRTRQRPFERRVRVRFLRVRGALKVKCHLMFGIVALAVDQSPSGWSTTGQHLPDPAGFTLARRRKIHLLRVFCKKLSGSNPSLSAT